MTRQTISTGSGANDGTGDTLRQAAQKINENFEEIYLKFGGDSNILSQVVSITAAGIEVDLLGNTFTLTAIAPPSSNRIILLPDADGTVTINEATQTLLNKTLTAPTITSPKIGTPINDSNGNEIIKLSPAASAVNEITIANAAIGQTPSISATGTNTNINLSLSGKGTGAVTVNKFALESVDQGASGSLLTTDAHVYLTQTGTISVADGVNTGEVVVVTNQSGGTVNLQPTSSNIAGVTTQIALTANDTVSIIWGGTKWYITGGYGYVVS